MIAASLRLNIAALIAVVASAASAQQTAAVDWSAVDEAKPAANEL